MMWPAVWPGVSITRASSPPTRTVSFSRTVSSTSGMPPASAVGRHHAAAVALLELLDAAGVIVVVMGDQDVGQLPAGRLERGLDRRRFRRVDRGGRAARRIVHEHAEIVLEAEEETGLRGHWGFFFCHAEQAESQNAVEPRHYRAVQPAIVCPVIGTSRQ